MWKVVVTEIQDAHVLEPSTVPPGAFFVSTERLSRTVENLDLQALIGLLDQAQSPPAGFNENRPVAGKRVPRQVGPSRSIPLRETKLELSRTAAMATKLFPAHDL